MEIVSNPEGTPTPQGQEGKPVEGETLLAGKFKTPQDLEKAYNELQTKLGSSTPKPEPKPATPEGQQSHAGDKGKLALDFSQMTAEIQRTGEISQESRMELLQAGIPQEVVDTHIKSVKANIETVNTALHEAAGGPQNYAIIKAWAQDNLTQDQRDGLNSLASTGVEGAKDAVEVMVKRFEAVNGKLGTMIGGSNPGSNGAGFNSLEEYKTALKDERYKKDTAYQAEVMRKLEHTTAF